MGAYVANQVVKLMIKRGQKIEGSKVLVLGITFKENCPDVRNSKVIDIIRELKEFGTEVEVYDPWADKDDVKKEYGIKLIEEPKNCKYDAIVLAVAHHSFLTFDYQEMKNGSAVLFDVKGILPGQIADARL